MEIKNYFAQDAQGNIMPSAYCYLYLPGTTTLATGLVDGNGVPISNPFLASSIGQVTFGAPNGVYDLRIELGVRDTKIEIQCADLLQALNETASFLGAKSSAPSTRNDGSPLQLSDRYLNTTDQVEYIYKSEGWTANNLDGQLLASSQGASLIGAVMQDGSLGTVQKAITDGDVILRKDLSLKMPVSLWDRSDFVTNKPNVADPSTWDWSPALQALVDADIPVSVPPGVFPLFTPVYVKQGTSIIGTQGLGAGYIQGSFFKPTTHAFLSSNFDLQQVFFRLTDIGFIGGTLVMDLGLFHEVDVFNVSFFNPSIGGMVVVRGEKHRFERIRMDARSPGIFGFSIGRWEESVHPGYSDAYFGVDGAFFDRATFKDIALQGGAGGYFAYGFKANILSATVFDNVITHNDKKDGEISALYVRTRMQMCTVNGWAPDRWGSVASPCPALFDLAFVNSCTFNNMSPSFAGNNDITYGIRMSSAVNTVMNGCLALGDNVTKFGIATGNATGQTLALIACRGAFFHASTSAPVRRQIVQIGCQFEGGNNAGSSNFNTTNQDMISTLLADTNGSAASTAAWGLEFSNGGGSIRRSVYARKEGLFISGALAFPNAFGEATGPKLIVNAASNITPEGVITAPPASLYLFYNGTTQGKLYVKETGNGNTGWVVK